MLYRKFGRTGEVVSAIGMGGSHIAQPNAKRDESIKLVHQAIDRGITFLDNCWDYNEGRSEEWMGAALAESGYRNKVFLMTKIDGRNKENAADQINDSLTRLKTDRIDLLQFTRFFALMTRIVFSVRAGLWKPHLQLRMQGRFDLLALPAIRIRMFTYTCWRWLPNTGFNSMLC